MEEHLKGWTKDSVKILFFFPVSTSKNTESFLAQTFKKPATC